MSSPKKETERHRVIGEEDEEEREKCGGLPCIMSPYGAIQISF